MRFCSNCTVCACVCVRVSAVSNMAKKHVKVNEEKWNFCRVQITCEFLERHCKSIYNTLRHYFWARESVYTELVNNPQIHLFTRCERRIWALKHSPLSSDFLTPIFPTLSHALITAIEMNLGRCHVRFISTSFSHNECLFAPCITSPNTASCGFRAIWFQQMRAINYLST